MASKKGSPKQAASGSSGSAKKRSSTDPTAAAARRAAEAAAGLRNGKQVWFVLRNDEPHRLQAHYSEQDAAGALAKAGAGYVKMGPYLTDPDAGVSKKKKKIEWIKVKLVGDPKEYSLDPETRDALFWSVAAMDKFMLPYYTMVYGPERAAAIRKQYLESDAAFECHDPISDPCNFP